MYAVDTKEAFLAVSDCRICPRNDSSLFLDMLSDTNVCQIQIGLMDQRNCPIRGKRCFINIRKKANANEVIAAGLSKFRAHDRQALLTNVSLHYPDGSFVSTLPEGDELFCISAYKGQLMKDYQRIVLYLRSDGELLSVFRS